MYEHELVNFHTNELKFEQVLLKCNLAQHWLYSTKTILPYVSGALSYMKTGNTVF